SGAEMAAPRGSTARWKWAVAAVMSLAAMTAAFMRLRPETAWYANPRFVKLAIHSDTLSVVLSPGAKYVGYVRGEGGQWSLHVRLLAADSDAAVVPLGSSRIYPLMFSPDESYLYYVSVTAASGDEAFYRVPVLGGTPQKQSFIGGTP